MFGELLLALRRPGEAVVPLRRSFRRNRANLPTARLLVEALVATGDGKAAEKLFPIWRKRFEEWKKVGSDRPYHYLGSAIWFNRIGKAFGQAMVELCEKK